MQYVAAGVDSVADRHKLVYVWETLKHPYFGVLTLFQIVVTTQPVENIFNRGHRRPNS